MGWEQARPSRPACWAGYVLPQRSGGGSACRSGRGGAEQAVLEVSPGPWVWYGIPLMSKGG